MQPTYGDEKNFETPYDLRVNSNPVVNNTDGSTVGYKYYNFDLLDTTKGQRAGAQHQASLGTEGRIDIMVDSPWSERGGRKIGSLTLSPNAKQERTDMAVKLSGLKGMKGKHAIYLLFTSPTKDKSMCELHELTFRKAK